MPALPSLHYPYVFRPKNRKSMFSFEHERVQTAVGNDDVRGPTSNIEKLERRRSSYPHVFPSKLKRSKSAANLTTNADMKVPLTTIVEDQKSALDTFDEELARRIARAQRFVVEEQRRQFELYGKEDENRKKMQAEEEKQYVLALFRLTAPTNQDHRLEPPVTPLGESFNMNRPIVRGTSTSKGPLFWMDAVRNLRNR